MGAIIKRELSSYFNSATAYIVMAVFFGFSGMFFVFTTFVSNTSTLSYTFSNMFIIFVIVIPILTMKSLSEEKHQRTDQALLCSPTSLFEIVMGKFLGAFILFAICCCVFLLYGVILTFFAVPDWSTIVCTLIGVLLFGAALIAIDIFISSLTESQIISAIVGMAVGIVIYMWSSLTSMISIDWIKSALNTVSFTDKYSNFTYGILDLSNIVFFLSVIALFIFFTIRILERKRWS